MKYSLQPYYASSRCITLQMMSKEIQTTATLSDPYLSQDLIDKTTFELGAETEE